MTTIKPKVPDSNGLPQEHANEQDSKAGQRLVFHSVRANQYKTIVVGSNSKTVTFTDDLSKSGLSNRHAQSQSPLGRRPTESQVRPYTDAIHDEFVTESVRFHERLSACLADQPFWLGQQKPLVLKRMENSGPLIIGDTVTRQSDILPTAADIANTIARAKRIEVLDAIAAKIAPQDVDLSDEHRRQLFDAINVRTAELGDLDSQIQSWVQSTLQCPKDDYAHIWRLFDAIERASSPVALDMWEEICGKFERVHTLQTYEFDAITAAIASQRQYLLRVSGQSHEVISFIGPQAFGRLVDYRARVHQGLTKNLHSSAQQNLYDRLPVPLRNLVDNRAMRQPVYRPNPDHGVVVHVAGDNDWFQHHALNWGGATKVVRSSRPNPRVRGSGPFGHLFDEAYTLRCMGWSDQQIAQLQRDRKDYRQVGSGQAVSLHERPERFLANPPPVVSIGKLMHGLLLRELHTIVDLYEPYVDELPEFGEQLELGGVSVPNSIRAIWPRLRQIPGSAQRKKALPWLLLSYMAQAAGNGGRIYLEDLKEERFKGDPWARENLEGLYVEAAPDQSHERNVLRTQFAGELDNEVRRQLRKYAPELLRFVPSGKSIVPETVSQISACTPGKPLANVNVIAVQHLLDDNVGLIASLQKFGVDPNCTHVLGVPYSTCEPDADVLRASGVDVDTRERRGLPYDAWRSVQVCNLIRKSLADHAQNKKPIVVLDDGGYVSKALHKYFPEHASKFVIVEQTTRGLTVAKDLELRCDVINIAKSKAKMLELPGLEYRFEQQVRARLDPFAGGDFMPGKPAAVLGYGWIGMTTARAMRELGRAVVVVEPDPIKRAQAERDGYRTVASADQIIHEAAIIAGCTGKQSLTKEQLHSLRHGPVLFSASSSNVEFDLPNDSRFHDDMLVQGDGYNYLVLGAGFPINFTGAGDINTPEELQYTRGAMLYGAIQGAASFAKRGADWKPQIVDLEETYDAHLLKMSETLGTGVSNRQEDEEESSNPFARFGQVGGRFGAWKR